MIPDVNYSPDIADLFANFAVNWKFLFPAVALLVGIYFGTFILKKLKQNFF